MGRNLRASLGLVAVSGAALGLVGAGTGFASSPHPHAASSTPTLKVTSSKKHGFVVSGPTTMRPGVVNVVVNAGAKPIPVNILRVSGNYSIQQYEHDFATFNKDAASSKKAKQKKAVKLLNRAVSHLTFYGGVDANPGESYRYSVKLKPGHYYIYRQGGQTITHATALTVAGTERSGSLPKAAGTVKAKSGFRFGGSTSMPHKGYMTFENTSHGSTASPHFLVFLQVKQGTTRKQIISDLQQNDFSFVTSNKGVNTDIVSPGQQMRVHYHLAKGEYAELCFFPDLKTLMPHALMGMVKTVQLT
jgi:hypothetical protein